MNCGELSLYLTTIVNLDGGKKVFLFENRNQWNTPFYNKKHKIIDAGDM